jgi:hypothetical protein
VDTKVAAIKAARQAAALAASRAYDLAVLTGTDRFELGDANRQELRKFVAGGGTLLIDAAGGAEDFAESAEQMLARLFPENAGQLQTPLSPSSPLFAADGRDRDYHYRQFARNRLGNLRGPQIRGITIGGRLAVIFSKEDLTAGIVGEPVDGIVGYDPETATAIVRDVILQTATTNQPTGK